MTIHKQTVGDFTLYTIQDAVFNVNPEAMATNLDEAARSQAFQEFGDDPEAVPLAYNVVYIDTGQHKVLVDAGQGGDDGKVLQELAALGVSPVDIDIVILTHGHGDHYAGMTTEDGEIVFKNAPHIVWADEWNYWTSEENLQAQPEARATQIRQRLLPIEPQLRLVDMTCRDILPGISCVPAPGHTPAHIAVLVESGDDKHLLVADAFIHPLHVSHPDWQVSFDTDHVQSEATRSTLLELAIAQDATVQAYHFAFPGIGTVSKVGEAYTFIAD